MKTKQGRYARQITDPRTGRRRWVVGDSAAEVAARCVLIRRQAEDARLALVSQEELATRVAAAVEGPLTVERLWFGYLQGLGRWKIKAEGYWRNHLRQHVGGLAVVDLSEERMVAWAAALRAKQLGRKTIQNIYDCLAGACARAVRDRRLSALPWGSWRPPKAEWRGPELDKRELVRSPEELERLVRAAWRLYPSGDAALLVAFAALTGLRQGELAGLGWDDCELDCAEPTLWIRHQAVDGWRQDYPEWTRPLAPPKHRVGPERQRHVLHSVAAAALRAQRERLRGAGVWREDGPVWPAAGGAWRSQALTLAPAKVRRIAAAAGLPRVELWVTHSLRHSFATLELAAAVQGGGDARAAQERMRHRGRKTLETYYHRLGRGLPEPQTGAVHVPELAAHAGPPQDLDPWGLEAPVRAEALQRGLDAKKRAVREEKRQAYLGRGSTEFARIWVAWHEAGRPGARPRQVTERADQAYRRAFQARGRGGADAAACKRAGVSARQGTLGAWAKFVQSVDARAVRAAVAPEPEPERRPAAITERKGARAKPVAEVYGELRVLAREGTSRGGRATYRCACSCGVEVVAAGGDLRAGRVTSCGHARAERGRALCHGFAAARRRGGERCTDIPTSKKHT